MSKIRIISPNDDDFARKVIDLYRHATKHPGKPYLGDQDLDVRRVALGLTFMKQLLDEHSKRPHKLADIPETAIAEAYGILIHLTTGSDHPIARHIKSLRTRRPQNAPANAIDKARQANIVGVVRAYAAVANVADRAAVRKVAETLHGTDAAVTEAQLRGWHVRSDELADKFASHLLSLAAPDAGKVLSLGITHILCLSGVPKIQEVQTPRPGSQAPLR
jgi:hypothetical protein